MLVSAPLAALARGEPVHAVVGLGRAGRGGRRAMLLTVSGRAPRRDGGLGRGGRGLGGGDARAGG